MSMPIEVREVMSAPGDESVAKAVSEAPAENLLRELAPQVLGAVVRRFGDFAAAEDAVQEALLAAAVQWPEQGVPDNPRGWLIQVASRRMTDQRARAPWRGDAARPPPRQRPRPTQQRCPPPTAARTPSRTTRSSCSSCAAIRR